MSPVRLGLCCARPEGLRPGAARTSLENALRFFQDDRSDESVGLARLDATPADLEGTIGEAVDQNVTHLLFLSPGVLLPFYFLQSLLGMRQKAVSGISWTWRIGHRGQSPEVFPRIGYFDPEGRAFPYFGWSAPDIFEVDWCGLDCLLLARGALEEIAAPLASLRHSPPALRISQALRSRGIRIIIDSFIQCPKVVMAPSPSGEVARGLVPGPKVWREFSRNHPHRRIPRGPVLDPAYRGRPWYREWVERCLSGVDSRQSTVDRS